MNWTRILRERAARASRAPHSDGARIALAIEGGAMRGIVSAGMVSALEALGLTHAFDAVYGSSAGAINGAYFLAGQAKLGTTIYSEDINNHRFIDLRRPMLGRPIVNLDFLMTDVVTRLKPLDTPRLLASTTPLTVMATDVDTAGVTALRDFEDAGNLYLALRAGATMPVIAGPPVSYRGHRFLDASLTEPVPVRAAEAEGFTHILALLTRPTGTPRKSNWLDRWYVLPRLRRASPALAALYSDRGGPYAELLAHIEAGRGPAGRAQVMGVRPAAPEVSRLERDATVLRAASQRGFAAVMEVFGPASARER